MAIAANGVRAVGYVPGVVLLHRVFWSTYRGRRYLGLVGNKAAGTTSLMTNTLSMPTCKTCIHWVDARLDNFGKPMNAMEWTKECTSPKLIEAGGQFGKGMVAARDLLIYSYYEGGSFNTGPDFGCVHHSTAKPGKDE